MNKDFTLERFMEDVKDHALTIERCDGVYRHLKFRTPGTIVNGFDIVTWPGYLAYTGDMGCFVFARLQDMLCFFRQKSDGPIEVNLGYWSEKVQAAEKNEGYEEYSPAKFRQVIADYLEEDEDATDELRQAVDAEVLSMADASEHEEQEAARSFEWQGREYFTDFWERNVMDYTYRFVWCCHAIVWGIRMFDVQRKSGE